MCGWVFRGIMQDMALATRQALCQIFYPILMYGRANFAKPTCYKIFCLNRAAFLPTFINSIMFAESLPKSLVQGKNTQHRNFQAKK